MGEQVMVEVTAQEYLDHLRAGRARQLSAWRELMRPWQFRDPWAEGEPQNLDISSEEAWKDDVDGLVVELVRHRYWDLHDILDKIQARDDANGAARSQLRKVTWSLLRLVAKLRQENLSLGQEIVHLRRVSHSGQDRDLA